MFCMKCGKEITEGDVFCANCGAKVETINKAEPANKTELMNESVTDKKPIKIIKLIGGIVACVLILSLICYTVFTAIIEPKEDRDNYGSLSEEDIDFSSETADLNEAEYTYVGDVMDHMTSDVINENVEIEGYAMFASMGMDGSDGNTISVVIRDENWNGTIALNDIDDYDIESYGLEDGDYCSVKGYIYYDEYDSLVIDVHDIEVL